MVRKSFAVLTALFTLICLLGITVSAAGQRVFDDAALFSQSDIADLQKRAEEFTAETSMDLVILTSKNVPGGGTRDFADDYYDLGGFGEGNDRDGLLYLIDMSNREVYISTRGLMIRYVTDDRLEELLDIAFDNLAAGNFAQSARDVTTRLREMVELGIPEGQYNYDPDNIPDDPGDYDWYDDNWYEEHYGGTYYTPYRELTLPEILLSLIIGAGVAAVIYVRVSRSYSMKQSAYSYDFNANHQFALKNQSDVFLRRNVHRVPKPPPPPPSSHSSGGGGGGFSGGSGSSTHTSSSGATHGGGGRSF
ncbi:MAG: TPM domain-containing protein [Oscillospiraceae bacterium]|nr:TPM domain-containing protein [Oscillospiraceae bacterium]